MASSVSVFPKAVNVLGESLNAERNLWRNVLIAALEDAIKPNPNKNFGCVSIDLARSYFTDYNRDFALVCQYAGLDHEYVRMKAKQYFKKEERENGN